MSLTVAGYQLNRTPFFLSNDATEFGGSIFQSVTNDLSTGIQLSWSQGQNNTRFGIAAKYCIDDDASINVSIFWMYAKRFYENMDGGIDS